MEAVGESLAISPLVQVLKAKKEKGQESDLGEMGSQFWVAVNQL